jgi:hypothetical protein
VKALESLLVEKGLVDPGDRASRQGACARPASRHATTAEPNWRMVMRPTPVRIRYVSRSGPLKENAWEPTAAAAAAEAPMAPRAFAMTPIPAAARINIAARVRHIAPPSVAWASRVYQFKSPHPTTIAAVRVARARTISSGSIMSVETLGHFETKGNGPAARTKAIATAQVDGLCSAGVVPDDDYYLLRVLICMPCFLPPSGEGKLVHPGELSSHRAPRGAGGFAISASYAARARFRPPVDPSVGHVITPVNLAI